MIKLPFLRQRPRLHHATVVVPPVPPAKPLTTYVLCLACHNSFKAQSVTGLTACPRCRGRNFSILATTGPAPDWYHPKGLNE